jgi:hypothetical protein
MNENEKKKRRKRVKIGNLVRRENKRKKKNFYLWQATTNTTFNMLFYLCADHDDNYFDFVSVYISIFI